MNWHRLRSEPDENSCYTTSFERNGVNAIAKILGVAALWAITGIFTGWSLQALFGAKNWLLLSCGSLNGAIGMALLQITTLSEDGRNLFYEGKKPHEDYLNFGVVLLWGFPIILIFSSILWWLASKLFPL